MRRQLQVTAYMYSTASASVVDQCHYNADSDPDPTFHFDADPDTYPSPCFKNVGKLRKIHSSVSLYFMVFVKLDIWLKWIP